jgi:hypothetical protein
VRWGEKETKRNGKHEARVGCEAKTCSYACPEVCSNQREEVPVVRESEYINTVTVT